MGLLQDGTHAAVTVQWPLVYANEALVGKGTVLNVSPVECRVAGTMPVTRGMQLKVWISPKNRPDAIYLEEARVLWAGDNQFWLEMLNLDAEDRQWLMGFFEQC